MDSIFEFFSNIIYIYIYSSIVYGGYSGILLWISEKNQ